jgi:hypothetical protein
MSLALLPHKPSSLRVHTQSCVKTTHRWHNDNGPRPTDLEGPLNLIKACPKTLKRFVFVTSAGVERQKEFPWAILNTFGEGGCGDGCLCGVMHSPQCSTGCLMPLHHWEQCAPQGGHLPEHCAAGS